MSLGMANAASKLNLSQVPRQKLTESVAQQLLAAVRGLAPGTRVPSERELTKELGVGRSTVREALNGLALLGVVEIRHGQGVFVVDNTTEDAEVGMLEAALERGVTKEFIEARLLVEVEVARLAAQRRTDDDLKQIADALRDQERRLEGKLDELLPVAANFNVLLAEAAHNEVLVAIVQSFVGLMMERAPKLYGLEGFAAWDLAEHRTLYEAVRDQDAELAGERMRRHVVELAERYHAVGAG
jgi:GntR family transcriptional regulator, transcriptional repressor for pyruvate dehydrogenase complex